MHDLLFHAADLERKLDLYTSPPHPAQTPNINSSFFLHATNAARHARDANDVPGDGCARQRGFGRRDATFGLKKAVARAV